MQENSGLDQSETIIEPPSLRLLRRLVMVLMVVMILGVISLVSLIVIRFAHAPGPILPAEITLPDGTSPTAVTAGKGWYAVVTVDQHILIYDSTTGKLLQNVPVKLQN